MKILNIFTTHTSNKSTKEIIEEIHESFYTEVDRLLSEAKVAHSLDTNKQGLIDKCNRLKSLGFTNTLEVKQAEEEITRLSKLKQDNESKKEIIEAINYFSFKYPNYKFITEDSVKKICQRYGLIYGEISKYLGTVPDKNLKQIEQFSIKEEDDLYLHKTGYLLSFRGRSVSIKYVDFSKYLQKKLEYDTSNAGYIDLCIKAPLEIAAPMKDFNTEGMEVKDFKLSKIEIPDPVVLKPVFFKDKKHYLIVTAWGEEASDPSVVNEKFN